MKYVNCLVENSSSLVDSGVLNGCIEGEDKMTCHLAALLLLLYHRH